MQIESTTLRTQNLLNHSGPSIKSFTDIDLGLLRWSINVAEFHRSRSAIQILFQVHDAPLTERSEINPIMSEQVSRVQLSKCNSTAVSVCRMETPLFLICGHEQAEALRVRESPLMIPSSPAQRCPPNARSAESALSPADAWWLSNPGSSPA